MPRQDSPKREEPIDPLFKDGTDPYSKEGLRIYLELIERYPERSVDNMDIIMNSMCAALVCLAHHTVPEEDYKSFKEFIRDLIDSNL
jgi:predicted metallo-beta-lactamase superfamily hydrolase